MRMTLTTSVMLRATSPPAVIYKFDCIALVEEWDASKLLKQMELTIVCEQLGTELSPFHAADDP